jgi:hypothetical protein
LDISLLFFHRIIKLVQALHLAYDEIYQVLVVEGHILLSKPLLDLSFDGGVRWKLPTLEMFFQYDKHINFFLWGVGVGSDDVSSMWPCIIVQLQHTLGKQARPLMSDCFLNDL